MTNIDVARLGKKHRKNKKKVRSILSKSHTKKAKNTQKQTGIIAVLDTSGRKILHSVL